MDSLTARRQLTPLEEADALYSSRCNNHQRPSLRFPPPPKYPPPTHLQNHQQTHQSSNQSYHEDLDRIEICVEEPSHVHFKSLSKRQNPEPQVLWKRDNIAATMERFEPSDYSYAYYEPGPATRHNNVPHPASIPGPSTSNLTTSLKQMKPGKTRHSYITRYGTQENIYEEIGDVAARQHLRRAAGLQQSMISLNQSIVEEEFRRVQTRHRRVLGELNLSVEAMLMPTSPNDSPEADNNSETGDNLAELLAVGPTDELLSPANCNPDLDSGFSGSSSGASYVGSLRYRSHFPRSSTPLDQHNPSANQTTVYGSQRSEKQQPESNKSAGKGFWKKGWRKIPGFSSTTSVNKAGVSDEPRLHTGTWEDPLNSTHSGLTSINSPSRGDIPPLRIANRTLGSQRRHPVGSTNNLGSSTNNISKGRNISSEDSWGSNSEHEISSDEESERSATSSTRSNGQLRSTLNKARTLCDKWRSGGTSGSNNHINSNTNSSVTSNMAPTGDPLHPGDSSPGGRLSRWFSIRRGSTHQYDVGGGGGSVDERDGRMGGKMPQLPEVDEDTMTQTFHSRNPSISSTGFAAMNSTASPPASSPSALQCTTTIPLRERRTVPPSLPPAPAGLTLQQQKRRHIVQAIVHSENSYVATLQRLVNDYKKPLEESSPPILSSSKISTLFHRLPEILQCHNLFRIALADHIRSWDRDEKLGEVFFASFSKSLVLDIYSGFINNFSVAMDLAKMEAKRKSALADFFKVKQISAHDRLSFFGLMVKPVQRFPQFILFLQDLLKHTPQGHHDRMNLQLALTQLESLAEMLNERKREAEQCQGFKEMLGHISGAFNVRTLSDSNRYLIREDNVTQLEYNQNGMITKSKSRRLLLLNDRVVCVSVAPRQSHDFGATEKLSFKWMYPVTDVEIQDNSASPTLSRILTAGLNRGGSIKSNSSAGNGLPESGADSLCSEMSNLMHDFEVMSRISDLVGTLKGSYADMTVENTRRILNSIQSSIQRKDEEMAWVDSCCLQLICRKNGKEETFTFQTDKPAVKREWMTELRLAQLALDGNNSPAWEVPEQEQRPVNKMPLFVKAQCVYKSQHQTEVRCGCFYTVPAPTRSRRRGRAQSYLWVCTNDGASSHIAILAQHHQQSGNLKDVSAFHLVETQVTAMEFVKGANLTLPLGTDTVWMGTDSRRLLIYAATEPEREEQVAHTTVPAVITQIRYHCDCVYVALGNGSLLIYRRGLDNAWLLRDPQSVNVGVEAIPSILTINSNIYAACGKKVWVLNGFSGEIQKSFSVQHEHVGNVNLMAHSGIGLWISMKNSSTICLYHTETFKHLQDINIASNVIRVTTSASNGCGRDSVNNNSLGAVVVTALLACKGLLWVGTNVGISLTVPLPRLEGVPIISGRFNISYHAHFGPISFLLPLVTKTYIVNTIKEIEKTPEKLKDAEKLDEPEKAKLEKQLSDTSMASVTAKLRQQLTNSPVVLRRRRSKDNDMARISKTLPRSIGTGMFSTSTTSSQGSGDTCDVYGLYGELMYIKDYEEGDGTLGYPVYESLRRSDPELAAIPGKVSTLDRRLRLKTSRPRSLDLSNWSVDSRSSSLYTSSGSEESMALRNGRSVSRNNSNASRTITLNNGTNELIPAATSSVQMNNTLPVTVEVETVMEPLEPEVKIVNPNPNATSTVNLKSKTNNKNKNAKNTNAADTRRTIITLMGGRGYVNWRQPCCLQDKPRVAGTAREPNSNDAHIVIWEKKL